MWVFLFCQRRHKSQRTEKSINANIVREDVNRRKRGINHGRRNQKPRGRTESGKYGQ